MRQRGNCTSRTHMTTLHWHQLIALGAIHSFPASGASSLNNTGILSPRGLRVTLLRAISTLAILALYIFPGSARSQSIGGGVFSHHQTQRQRFTSQSVIDCYSILSTRPTWTHRRCNTHCEASIAAYLRMPFFASTIPMPTSVTSMDHCDHSMHITDLNRGIETTCAHRSHDRTRAKLLNEIASRTRSMR